MELLTEANTKITLSPSDFKAAGGEGAVYVKANTAYKVYGYDDNGRFVFAPQKMIPLGKIQELGALTEPDIIKPESVLRDPKGVPVGYAMRAVPPGGVALCQTFPKAYKDRHNLTPDKMLGLVQKVQAGVAHVHSKNLLVVDLNEMNFLVDAATFDRVYFIDVDSYQTPHFPATAIMDSIRDRHAQTFSEGTDWFSFGIVSFQMLVGVHPYKGKHPNLTTLDARMLGNVSVFDKAVRLPHACLPLDTLPQNWRDWYEAVFARGVRVAPPTGLFATVTISPQITRTLAASNNFVVTEIGAFDGPVLECVGNVVLTTRGVFVGARRVGDAPSGSVLGLSPQTQRPILGRVENGRLVLTDVLRQTDLPLSVAADAVQSTTGRIIALQNGTVLEVSLTELPSGVLPGVSVIGTVLPQAAQLFSGVVLQNLLGAMYANLLPDGGAFCEVRVPELDNRRIMDAHFERGVLVVLTEKGGVYDRFVFRFDANTQVYDVRQVSDVPVSQVNFTVLDTGVVALMNEAEELELFAKTRGSSAVKLVPDPVLSGDARLFSRGAQTLIARDNRLANLTMNKTP